MNTIVYPARRESSSGRNGASMALACARNVYAAVDHRTPEAPALAEWLAGSAASFGLSEAAVPEQLVHLGSSRRGGVTLADWRRIKRALVSAAASSPAQLDTPMDRWIAAITVALALEPAATGILAVVLHYVLDKRVTRLFDALSSCRGKFPHLHRDAGLFALLLGISTAEAATQLMGDAKLMTSGLLQLGRLGGITVQDRLVSLLRQDVAPAADFYDQLLGSSQSDPLPWEAFAHLGPQADVAASVLKAALSGREQGIGILLYGPPGTGKTSFAATLAARVGARLRSVAETDDDGDEPERNERLAGLRLAQQLAKPQETLLLFDEAEDLFVSRSGDPDNPTTSSRVFIHRMLEHLAVPVIWTANDISVLGPAVLRRMTMCLELKVPNVTVRTKLWRSMAQAEGIVLQNTDAARLARLVPAAPAVASGALRATRLAGGGADTTRLIVEGLARAMRGGEMPAPDKEPDKFYDAALVNVDCDLAALTHDLLQPDASRAFSFLLSGPPGAGKSAWVRHLAGRMGLPVLQKRASDLLDPFVGGTEQRIAEAFAEAREAQAFLVFDEADSLLLERADAMRSWEISQVNEMLTWMESHTLPFACTTNLAERLDRASLRRFLVKVRFDWLTAAQARLAFRHFFGVAAPAELDDLRTLTPADFALVRRRTTLHRGQTAPSTVLRLLAAECDGRTGGRTTLGFGRSAAAV